MTMLYPGSTIHPSSSLFPGDQGSGSAVAEFLLVSAMRRSYFTRYTQGSVVAFGTQFNTDWGGVLGAVVTVVARAGASTVAEIILVGAGLVLEVNPGDYVGCNYGSWQVLTPAQMSASYVASNI